MVIDISRFTGKPSMDASDVRVFDFPIEQDDLSKSNWLHFLNQIMEPPRQPAIGYLFNNSKVYRAFLRVGDTLRPLVSMFNLLIFC